MGRAGEGAEGGEALWWEWRPHSEQAPCPVPKGRAGCRAQHSPGEPTRAPGRALGHGPWEQPPCAPSTHPSHGHGCPWGFNEGMGHREQTTAPSPSAGQRNMPKQPNPPYLWVWRATACSGCCLCQAPRVEAREGTTTTLAKKS